MTPTQNTAGECLTQSSPAVRAAFLPVGRRITSPALVRPRRGLLGTLPSRLSTLICGQHIYEKLTLGQPRRRNGALAGEGAGQSISLGTFANYRNQKMKGIVTYYACGQIGQQALSNVPTGPGVVVDYAPGHRVAS